MSVRVISRDMVDRDTSGRLYIVDAPAPAYHGRHRPYKCRAKQTTPRLDLVEEGKPVALDIEGVLLPDEVSIGKCGVGRLSITNEEGEVIYDVFAHYPSNINHRPPPQRLTLGVKYKDIMPVHGARPISEVLANAERIFAKSGIVICHACENEIHYVSARELQTTDGESIDIYGFDLTQFRIHDTQMFEEYREFGAGRQRKPRLAVLASAVLGQAIQVGEHSSVEDAQASMELFLRRREEFEAIAESRVWTAETMAIPDSIDGIIGANG